MLSISCPGCGADLPLPPSCDFLSCAYCQSTLFADTADVVRCLYTPVSADAGRIVSYLRRFLSEYELSSPVELSNFEGLYLPFWRLSRQSRVLERPAFSVSYESLQGCRLPQGVSYRDVSEDDRRAMPMRWLAPELSLETMLGEWRRIHQEPAENLQTELRYVPVFTVEYSYENRTYRATVDGVTGAVLPEEIPPNPVLELNRRAVLWSLAVASVFFVEAALLPGFWLPAAACAATAAAFYPVLHRALLGGADGHAA
jgi:hypothetical protein